MQELLTLLIALHDQPPQRTYAYAPPVAAAFDGFPDAMHSSLKTMFRTFNGGTFLNYDNLDGFHIYSIAELISANETLKTIYGEDYDPALVVFREILGEGNYIAIGHKGEIYDGFHETNPKKWKVIEPSLGQWFQHLIEANGQKYWLT